MVDPEKSDQKWFESDPKWRISEIGLTFARICKDSEAVNIKGPSCPTVGRLLDAFSRISQLWVTFGREIWNGSYFSTLLALFRKKREKVVQKKKGSARNQDIYAGLSSCPHTTTIRTLFSSTPSGLDKQQKTK